MKRIRLLHEFGAVGLGGDRIVPIVVAIVARIQAETEYAKCQDMECCSEIHDQTIKAKLRQDDLVADGCMRMGSLVCVMEHGRSRPSFHGLEEYEK